MTDSEVRLLMSRCQVFAVPPYGIVGAYVTSPESAIVYDYELGLLPFVSTTAHLPVLRAPCLCPYNIGKHQCRVLIPINKHRANSYCKPRYPPGNRCNTWRLCCDLREMCRVASVLPSCSRIPAPGLDFEIESI